MKVMTSATVGSIKTKIDTKQDKLVSGTNIRTINNISLLGTGNIAVVPTTRKVNGYELDSNITLAASDVGALSTAGGTITGNLTLKGSGNYGNKINFGDSDYVHISEPTDDALEVKANSVNFVLANGKDGFTINGETLSTGSSGGGVTGEILTYTGSNGTYTLSKSGAEFDFIDIEVSDAPIENGIMRFWTNKKLSYKYCRCSHVDCGSPYSSLSIRLINLYAYIYGTTLAFQKTFSTILEASVNSSTAALTNLKGRGSEYPTSNLKIGMIVGWKL